jgi:hypothetical protein
MTGVTRAGTTGAAATERATTAQEGYPDLGRTPQSSPSPTKGLRPTTGRPASCFGYQGPHRGHTPAEDQGQQRTLTAAQRRRPAPLLVQHHRSTEHPRFSLARRKSPGARSALGPCRNGRARASADTSGHQRSRITAGRRSSGSGSWDDASRRFGLWSRRSEVGLREDRDRSGRECKRKADRGQGDGSARRTVLAGPQSFGKRRKGRVSCPALPGASNS